MDLSTLDNLLKTHVTHLEKLYTRLGTQDDIVADKLQQLHAALIATVDQQRKAAEDEVKLAEERIAELKEAVLVKQIRLGDMKETANRQGVLESSSPSLQQQQAALEAQNTSLARELQRRAERIEKLRQSLARFGKCLGTDFMEGLEEEHVRIRSKSGDMSHQVVASLESWLGRCQQEQVRITRTAMHDFHVTCSLEAFRHDANKLLWPWCKNCWSSGPIWELHQTCSTSMIAVSLNGLLTCQKVWMMLLQLG